MSEFQHSITLNVSAQKAFDFVADVKNTPLYLPTVREAEAIGPERVRVTGETRHGRYDSEGWFRAHPETRRLEWGTGGDRQYSGSMVVEGDERTCVVIIHLSFGADPKLGDDAGAKIHRDMEYALESLQSVLEGSGRKVERDTHGATHIGQEPIHHQ